MCSGSWSGVETNFLCVKENSVLITTSEKIPRLVTDWAWSNSIMTHWAPLLDAELTWNELWKQIHFLECIGVTKRVCMGSDCLLPLNRPGWWKGKFALFQGAGNCRVGGGRNGGHLFKGWLPLTGNQWGKRFYRQKWALGRRLYLEIAQSVLTVIFKLIIGGLTSAILIVLGTVNLQFQGPFVAISLRPVLEIMAAYVMDTV